MTRNILIGIVVVVLLVAGGWWYINQSSAPATSETTELPTLQETTNTKNKTTTKPSVPATQTPTSNTQPATNSKPAANEVSFATPAGYVIGQEPSYQDAAWHEASGIDKRISILKEEYEKQRQAKIAAGTGTGGSASIIIDFYRNPQNLTAQQLLEPKGYSFEGLTTYSFKDRTGVRFTPSPGQHMYDGIAVQHKGWIVFILNSYDTDSEVQIFNQLLASITFAK